MKLRSLWIVLVLALGFGLSTQSASAQDKSYSANRFDSTVIVEEGGSLLVTETVEFDFVGGPFTFVFRNIPTDLTDGIDILSAKVDGDTFSVGENTGQIEIDDGNPIEMTWHFEPTSNIRRTFELTYRVNGVVRQEEGVDRLIWQPLPDSYEYFIAESETVIEYPSGANIIDPAVITEGTAEVQQSGSRIILTTSDLEPDTTLIVDVGFEAGSLITEPPAWQSQQAENQARLPFFGGIAAALAAIGIAGFVASARGRATLPQIRDRRPSPPSDLQPGIVGALTAYDQSPAWVHAQGTLFSLAEQGVLVIEEHDETPWWKSHEFSIKQVDPKRRAIAHEDALLDMLFEDKDGRVQSINFTDMAKKLSSKAWKAYKEAVESELKAAGFLDGERKNYRQLIYSASLILFAIGVALGILLLFLVRDWGIGPFLIPIGLLAISLTGVIAGSALTTLSDDGLRALEEWTQFKNYLQAVHRGREPINNPAMFEKYLPYAAAFGMLDPWSKRFEKEGVNQVPRYFMVAPNTKAKTSWASFMAMQGAFSTSGGSAAGAGAGAGGGAAGGGASGAG